MTTDTGQCNNNLSEKITRAAMNYKAALSSKGSGTSSVHGKQYQDYPKAVGGNNISPFGPAAQQQPTIQSLTQEKIILEEGDSRQTRKDGAPAVNFSTRIHQLMDRNTALSLIIRPLGDEMNINFLYSKLMAMWCPNEGIQLLDLQDGYFFVKLGCEEDYLKIMLQGPWSVKGQYLTIFPWERSFNTKVENIQSVATWIRVLGLPPDYFHEDILKEIVKQFETDLKADDHTLKSLRGQYARIAVKLDLRKELTTVVWVDDIPYQIQYEKLNRICYNCCHYGHYMEECKEIKRNSSHAAKSQQVPGTPDQNTNFPAIKLGIIFVTSYGGRPPAGTNFNDGTTFKNSRQTGSNN